MLFAVIPELPLISIFLFVKLLHGQGRLSVKIVAVVSNANPNHFIVSTSERILVLGIFDSAKILTSALLAEVALDAEKRFVCH
jgi:hypothetical protein